MFAKLHKDDYASHKPCWESTVGSWYCQQGFRRDHEAFSDYFESSVADEVNCRCLSRALCFVPLVGSFISISELSR